MKTKTNTKNNKLLAEFLNLRNENEAKKFFTSLTQLERDSLLLGIAFAIARARVRFQLVY